jgi:hypothetical protein
MMKPEKDQNQPFDTPRHSVLSASKKEIIRLFKAYDFKDPMGHPLTVCEDFLDLLARVFDPGQKP